MELIFEWDEEKAQRNLRKHGISFEEAALVFDDPLAVSTQDRIVAGECRWKTLGLVKRCLLLVVAHTVRMNLTEPKSSGLFQQDALNQKNGETMSKIRYKRGELPPISPEREAELRALAAAPSEDIDFSDIPPLDDDFWRNAVRNPFYRPVKIATSIRIDADVLAWLKSMGKGYQTRINEILRQAMLNSM